MEIPLGVPVGIYRVVLTGLKSTGGATFPDAAMASAEFEVR